MIQFLQKNGKCTEEGCLCEKNYIGDDCSIKECPDNCNESGECDFATGKCKCNEGFSGENCSKKVCVNDCSNKGTCDDGECKCNSGFTGKACEYSN